MTKNAKHVELDTKIGSPVLNTQMLKIVLYSTNVDFAIRFIEKI